MWLNFKTDNREQPTGGNGNLAKKLKREFSRQSSTRSTSSRSGKSSILKKLEEHEMKTKTSEWQKNQDYKMIRERRKIMRKQLGDKLRVVRRLYVPSILGVCLGIFFLFGATLRSLSDGTIFWTYREHFRIIGPTLLIIGLILLLTVIGMENNSREKLKKAGIVEIKPFIHPDFLEEQNRFDRQISKDSSVSSYDPTCSGLDRQRLFWKNKNQDVEDGFLCSSIASTSSAHVQENACRINLSDRWAKAMAVKLDSYPNTTAEHVKTTISSSDEDYLDNTNTSCDRTHFRVLCQVPSIEVTDTEKLSPPATPSSATGIGLKTMSSNEDSLQTSVSTHHETYNVNSNNKHMTLPINGSVVQVDILEMHGNNEENISYTDEHG